MPALPPGATPGAPGASGGAAGPAYQDAVGGQAVQAGASGPAAVVDAALAPLDQLDGRPVEEHVAVFDQVHRALQDALATLDAV